MKPAEIELLLSVSRPTVDPAGGRAVVSVTRPDLGADANVGQLWSVPLHGGTPRRITQGFRDTSPRFSPDGEAIAFLRAGRTTPPQLVVLPIGGGEPVVITDRKLGVTEFDWAPDSRSLVFVSREPEHGRYGTVEGLDPAAEPPRRLTEKRYRANGLGYVVDKRAHLFLVDLPELTAEPRYEQAPSPDPEAGDEPPTVPEPRRLTTGDFDARSPRFSPDGAAVAFVASRHETRDEDLRADIYELPVSPESGGEPVNRTAAHGNLAVHDLVFAAPGRLFFSAQELGESGTDFVARNAAIYLLDTHGGVIGGVKEEFRRLTDPEHLDFGDADAALTPVDDESVLAQNRSRGTLQLIRVTASGTHTALTSGPLEVTGSATARGAVVVTVAAADSTPEVALLEQQGATVLTDFSTAIHAAGVRPARELTVTGRDGYPVHGWVVLPEGDGPHPVLLNIHGGPFHAYTCGLFDEAQVYAAAGYAVVMCNPRGSAGYGQAHGRAIRRAMGTVDMHDVLDFLDGALDAHATLDRDRVGIMGGSYGGYLTAWILAHESRFAAGIVERGFLDPEFFAGTSDIGSYFGQEYVGTDPELVRSQSPQAVVDRVTSPTMVLHSADDLRCPLSQAERYFWALKARGVDTELVVFPGENHELSRNGRPRHRLQRFDAILDWWARHLPVGARD
jgi:dipeptidyl aminopeptidase/acylaminoacyl peptidase